MMDPALFPVAADAINPAPDTQPVGGALMSPDALPDLGRGCVIGVIDDAIPFAHERLRLPGPLSRVAAIWVQDARHDPQGPGRDLPCGIELRGTAITGWLKQLTHGTIPTEDTLYRMAGAVSMNRATTHSGAFAGGHGAAVSLLAAGFAPADPAARDHPLIGVTLAPGIIADASGTVATDALIAAVLFVITRARLLCRQIEAQHGLAHGQVRLPVVLNLSLGLTAGPRDGSSLIEQVLDGISDHCADDLGPVHVVLPTGNHRLARMRGTMRPGGHLGWHLPPDDRTPTPLEVWGPVLTHPPSTPMQLGLTPPGGAEALTAFVTPDQVTHLTDAQGRDLARAYYHVARPDGGWRECITVIVSPTCPDRPGAVWAPPGRWRLRLAQGAPGDHAVSVQRDDVLRGYPREARQSWLADATHQPGDQPPLCDALAWVQQADTVNAYATGRRCLRVGAVDGRGRAQPYASLIGPAEGGDLLVTVEQSACLPGMPVRGRSSGGFGQMGGSSMAAPQATRWLAGQLAGGAHAPDRAAIRVLAGGQPDGPPPVLPLGARPG